MVTNMTGRISGVWTISACLLVLVLFAPSALGIRQCVNREYGPPCQGVDCAPVELGTPPDLTWNDDGSTVITTADEVITANVGADRVMRGLIIDGGDIRVDVGEDGVLSLDLVTTDGRRITVERDGSVNLEDGAYTLTDNTTIRVVNGKMQLTEPQVFTSRNVNVTIGNKGIEQVIVVTDEGHLVRIAPDGEVTFDHGSYWLMDGTEVSIEGRNVILPEPQTYSSSDGLVTVTIGNNGFETLVLTPVDGGEVRINGDGDLNAAAGDYVMDGGPYYSPGGKLPEGELSMGADASLEVEYDVADRFAGTLRTQAGTLVFKDGRPSGRLELVTKDQTETLTFESGTALVHALEDRLAAILEQAIHETADEMAQHGGYTLDNVPEQNLDGIPFLFNRGKITNVPSLIAMEQMLAQGVKLRVEDRLVEVRRQLSGRADAGTPEVEVNLDTNEITAMLVLPLNIDTDIELPSSIPVRASVPLRLKLLRDRLALYLKAYSDGRNMETTLLSYLIEDERIPSPPGAITETTDCDSGEVLATIGDIARPVGEKIHIAVNEELVRVDRTASLTTDSVGWEMVPVDKGAQLSLLANEGVKDYESRVVIATVPIPGRGGNTCVGRYSVEYDISFPVSASVSDQSPAFQVRRGDPTRPEKSPLTFRFVIVPLLQGDDVNALDEEVTAPEEADDLCTGACSVHLTVPDSGSGMVWIGPCSFKYTGGRIDLEGAPCGDHELIVEPDEFELDRHRTHVSVRDVHRADVTLQTRDAGPERPSAVTVDLEQGDGLISFTTGVGSFSTTFDARGVIGGTVSVGGDANVQIGRGPLGRNLAQTLNVGGQQLSFDVQNGISGTLGMNKGGNAYTLDVLSGAGAVQMTTGPFDMAFNTAGLADASIQVGGDTTLNMNLNPATGNFGVGIGIEGANINFDPTAGFTGGFGFDVGGGQFGVNLGGGGLGLTANVGGENWNVGFNDGAFTGGIGFGGGNGAINIDLGGAVTGSFNTPFGTANMGLTGDGVTLGFGTFDMNIGLDGAFTSNLAEGLQNLGQNIVDGVKGLVEDALSGKLTNICKPRLLSETQVSGAGGPFLDPMLTDCDLERTADNLHEHIDNIIVDYENAIEYHTTLVENLESISGGFEEWCGNCESSISGFMAKGYLPCGGKLSMKPTPSKVASDSGFKPEICAISVLALCAPQNPLTAWCTAASFPSPLGLACPLCLTLDCVYGSHCMIGFPNPKAAAAAAGAATTAAKGAGKAMIGGVAGAASCAAQGAMGGAGGETPEAPEEPSIEEMMPPEDYEELTPEVLEQLNNQPRNGTCICDGSGGQVCGTDGRTYISRCVAECFEVQVARDGACEEWCTTDVDCVPDACCDTVTACSCVDNRCVGPEDSAPDPWTPPTITTTAPEGEVDEWDPSEITVDPVEAGVTVNEGNAGIPMEVWEEAIPDIGGGGGGDDGGGGGDGPGVSVTVNIPIGEIGNLGQLGGGLGKLGEGLGKIGDGLNAVTKPVQDLAQGVQNAVDTVTKPVTDAVKGVQDAIDQGIENMGDAITGGTGDLSSMTGDAGGESGGEAGQQGDEDPGVCLPFKGKMACNSMGAPAVYDVPPVPIGAPVMDLGVKGCITQGAPITCTMPDCIACETECLPSCMDEPSCPVCRGLMQITEIPRRVPPIPGACTNNHCCGMPYSCIDWNMPDACEIPCGWCGPVPCIWKAATCLPEMHDCSDVTQATLVTKKKLNSIPSPGGVSECSQNVADLKDVCTVEGSKELQSGTLDPCEVQEKLDVVIEELHDLIDRMSQAVDELYDVSSQLDYEHSQGFTDRRSATIKETIKRITDILEGSKADKDFQVRLANFVRFFQSDDLRGDISENEQLTAAMFAVMPYAEGVPGMAMWMGYCMDFQLCGGCSGGNVQAGCLGPTSVGSYLPNILDFRGRCMSIPAATVVNERSFDMWGDTSALDNFANIDAEEDLFIDTLKCYKYDSESTGWENRTSGEGIPYDEGMETPGGKGTPPECAAACSECYGIDQSHCHSHLGLCVCESIERDILTSQSCEPGASVSEDMLGCCERLLSVGAESIDSPGGELCTGPVLKGVTIDLCSDGSGLCCKHRFDEVPLEGNCEALEEAGIGTCEDMCMDVFDRETADWCAERCPAIDISCETACLGTEVDMDCLSECVPEQPLSCMEDCMAAHEGQEAECVRSCMAVSPRAEVDGYVGRSKAPDVPGQVFTAGDTVVAGAVVNNTGEIPLIGTARLSLVTLSDCSCSGGDCNCEEEVQLVREIPVRLGPGRSMTIPALPVDVGREDVSVQTLVEILDENGNVIVSQRGPISHVVSPGAVTVRDAYIVASGGRTTEVYPGADIHGAVTIESKAYPVTLELSLVMGSTTATGSEATFNLNGPTLDRAVASGSYTVQDADLGKVLRVHVKLTDSAGVVLLEETLAEQGMTTETCTDEMTEYCLSNLGKVKPSYPLAHAEVRPLTLTVRDAAFMSLGARPIAAMFGRADVVAIAWVRNMLSVPFDGRIEVEVVRESGAAIATKETWATGDRVLERGDEVAVQVEAFGVEPGNTYSLRVFAEDEGGRVWLDEVLTDTVFPNACLNVETRDPSASGGDINTVITIGTCRLRVECTGCSSLCELHVDPSDCSLLPKNCDCECVY